MLIRFRSYLAALVVLGAAVTTAARAESAEPIAFREAVIEPVKAKDVPAMRITLSAGTLTRTQSGYFADYRVDVFPFFFFSEHGEVQIEVSPEDMILLQAGQVISFSGKATNSHENSRLIDGRVYPEDDLSGRIRLVVHVGSIELIFKTTYRFQGEERNQVGDREPEAPSTPR